LSALCRKYKMGVEVVVVDFHDHIFPPNALA
jgi:hypothetical protein